MKEQWWWLSFVDEESDRCIGAAIVEATSFEFAWALTKVYGINPGGQVKGYPIPEEHLPDIPEDMRNRLVPVHELRDRLGAKTENEWGKLFGRHDWN